ncbi:MAG: hypothetical protein HQM09_07830 [Candidatus Riflebacteria bacterium]|nr:hypothetical protein [Candidatus Riflebacteria bacterium]
MNPMIAEYQKLNADRSGRSDRIDFPTAVKKFRAEHGSNPEQLQLLKMIEKAESSDITGMKNIINQIHEAKIADAEEMIRQAIEAAADAVSLPPSEENEKNMLFLKNFIEFQRYLIVEASAVIAECERRFEGATDGDDDIDDTQRKALC